MKKKAVPILAAVVLIVIVAAIGIISKIVERYTPSDEVMPSAEYFGVQEGSGLALIIQDELVHYKGILDNGTPYLDYQAVKEYLNDRFYWDSSANLMVYTTPTDIINIPAGGSSYTLSGTTQDAGYPIVKVNGNQAYIAAAFVQQYTNIEFSRKENPERLIITNQWGEREYADLKKDEAVRYQGGIKSPILTNGIKGMKLAVLEKLDDWTKVMTEDGYIGYVRNSKLGESYQETASREFEEPVYTSIRRNHKINLVWHQITSMESNDSLLNDIAGMKGVNVISPTWFSIISNDGEISSLVSETYVTNAHAQGLEVWALVDNFNEAIDTKTVLASSASREKLANQLVAAAVQYSLDGINIDFEAIPEEAADGYIQFIREISVKCRKNGIVLSIDNPVPMPYTMHYNRKEQGNFADYVIIMGYDEHYAGGDEGSVASIGFVTQGIADTLKEVPAEQVILAAPLYTRVWIETPKAASDDVEAASEDYVPYDLSSKAVGMQEAWRMVEANGVEPVWLEDCGQYYAEYLNENDTYKIWLEDLASMELRLQAASENGLAGMAFWTLGFEHSSFWDTVIKYMN